MDSLQTRLPTSLHIKNLSPPSPTQLITCAGPKNKVEAKKYHPIHPGHRFTTATMQDSPCIRSNGTGWLAFAEGDIDALWVGARNVLLSEA